MDKEILQNIIKGNKEAFKTLYDHYFDRGFRAAMAITKNKEMAKDAIQETFIRVYQNISAYDTNRPFEPWFYRILINECNRLLKKESKLKFVDHTFLENDRLAKDEKEDFSDLLESILSLKSIYRIPVILKYLQGFPEKEIASIMDLNVNTVKSRLFKGREKLRIALETMENRRKKI
ncbi:RNA polymerase sigma factor [Clostridiaceae bacterium 35-E11]